MKLFRYISVIALAAATAVNAYADKTNFRWIKDIDYAKVRHFSQGHSAFQENGKWDSSTPQVRWLWSLSTTSATTTTTATRQSR